MKTQVKALVVGGGAVGTSIAYHLAKAGWDDVMLIERDELTSGSTWHAAGLLPLFNMSYATTHIHQYSVEFYKQLEAETGLNAGFAVVGNLRMAQTQERMDEYMLYASTAETCGVSYEWLTPDQIKERWPLIRTEDLKGAIYHNTDGYINPADVTQAMAKGARQRGVMIERKWQADAFHWNGTHWEVTLSKMVEKGGNLVPSDEQIVVTAEHVVTASGNHAQRTAKMLGIKMPAIPVEHQFIVMDQDPELVKFRAEGGVEPEYRTQIAQQRRCPAKPRDTGDLVERLLTPLVPFYGHWCTYSTSDSVSGERMKLLPLCVPLDNHSLRSAFEILTRWGRDTIAHRPFVHAARRATYAYAVAPRAHRPSHPRELSRRPGSAVGGPPRPLLAGDRRRLRRRRRGGIQRGPSLQNTEQQHGHQHSPRFCREIYRRRRCCRLSRR